MGRGNSNSNYPCNLDKYCNNITNQYLFLASIYSAIISEEIEDDEALGILGTFLIVLGEEISLASELRIFCKSQFQNENNEEEQIEDVFDRCSSKSKLRPKVKKVRKKIRKKSQLNQRDSKYIF